MQGVLYVSHGTRLKEGEKEAIDFLTSLQSYVQAPLQQISFLELCSPSIEQGLEKLVKDGATAITVVPVLLLSAGHDKHDIPEELLRIEEKYPTISFRYVNALGVQDRLIDTLLVRIKEVSSQLNQMESVLLVGRGSYMQSTQDDIETIASKLGGKIDRQVDVSYLAACKPSFDETLLQMAESGIKTGIIIPYLLFNGLLLQSMKEKVEKYNQVNEANILLCNTLGDHPNIKQAFIDRAHSRLLENAAFH